MVSKLLEQYIATGTILSSWLFQKTQIFMYQGYETALAGSLEHWQPWLVSQTILTIVRL